MEGSVLELDIISEQGTNSKSSNETQSHDTMNSTGSFVHPLEESALSDDGTEDCHGGFIGQWMESFWTYLENFTKIHSLLVRSVVLIVLALLYNAYFVASIVYSVSNDMPMDYCNGVGLLIVVTVTVYVGLFYYQIVKRFFGETIDQSCLKPGQQIGGQIWKYRLTRYFCYGILLSGLITFLVLDSAEDRSRLYSFGGIFIFILFGWIFSKHPSKVRWRPVIWGIALQFLFGLMVLRWQVGRAVFQCLGQKFTIFSDYTTAGSTFVYGYLVNDQNNSGLRLGTVFAFNVLSAIFFFSFIINILYYYGVMQWFVQKIGWLLQMTLGTTAAESMNAAANIFFGQSEAPLVIKPYLSIMTKSELHAVMTNGFATIAGSVLAAYVSYGIDASHLLSASIMSAPAALAFSKLFYPESEKSKTKFSDIKLERGKEANALDAATQGAAAAVFLVLNICASLISFLSFVAFLNGVISWFAGLVGAPYLTFEYIIAKLFYPIPWAMGVPTEDCALVANLIAMKTIINEFAAYSKLGEYVKKGIISKRSEMIATYALCGFSSIAGIGSQMASIGTIAPNRRSDIAQIAFRALISGSMACFMTACIAGTLVSTSDARGPLSAVLYGNGTRFL